MGLQVNVCDKGKVCDKGNVCDKGKVCDNGNVCDMGNVCDKGNGQWAMCSVCDMGNVTMFGKQSRRWFLCHLLSNTSEHDDDSGSFKFS